MGILRQKTERLIRFFAHIVRSKFQLISQFRVQDYASLFKEAPDYPSSAASPLQSLKLTAEGAKSTFNRLAQIGKVERIPVVTKQDLLAEFTAANIDELATKLKALFDFHGSDKATRHQYHLLYAVLINKFDIRNTNRILEIGLGSNHTSVPSNMGPGGHPGASLRAWRDLDGSFEVVGVDIDSKILFEEERILTFQVDQLDLTSWRNIPGHVVQRGFDLIVDDGLHAPLANLNTLISTLPFLRPGGAIVVEDVAATALPVWTLLRRLVEGEFEITAFEFEFSYCILVTRS
jgi:hypothetical protein